MQRTSIDWTHLRDDAGAAGLAKAIEASKRQLRGGTSLGGAIRFSLERIENNRFEGRRKVIDVSGDGFTGHSPRRERDRALARGVTINGLAIENEKPRLGEYYAAHVIGGTGAFVMTVASFEDFAVAIRDKLIREIAGMVVAGEASAYSPKRQTTMRQPPASSRATSPGRASASITPPAGHTMIAPRSAR